MSYRTSWPTEFLSIYPLSSISFFIIATIEAFSPTICAQFFHLFFFCIWSLNSFFSFCLRPFLLLVFILLRLFIINSLSRHLQLCPIPYSIHLHLYFILLLVIIPFTFCNFFLISNLFSLRKSSYHKISSISITEEFLSRFSGDSQGFCWRATTFFIAYITTYKNS